MSSILRYAQSSEEMLEKHVGKWRGNRGEGVGFWRVERSHNDILRPDQVQDFWRVMGRVLKERRF